MSQSPTFEHRRAPTPAGSTLGVALAVVFAVVALGMAGVSVYYHNLYSSWKDQCEREQDSLRAAKADAEHLRTKIDQQDQALLDAEKTNRSCRAEVSENLRLLRAMQKTNDDAVAEMDRLAKKLAYYEETPGWRTLAGWNKLKRGMTQSEVSECLGSPPHSGHGEWHYPEESPESGSVRFDGRGLYVEGWKLPARFR